MAKLYNAGNDLVIAQRCRKESWMRKCIIQTAIPSSVLWSMINRVKIVWVQFLDGRQLTSVWYFIKHKRLHRDSPFLKHEMGLQTPGSWNFGSGNVFGWYQRPIAINVYLTGIRTLFNKFVTQSSENIKQSMTHVYWETIPIAPTDKSSTILEDSLSTIIPNSSQNIPAPLSFPQRIRNRIEIFQKHAIPRTKSTSYLLKTTNITWHELVLSTGTFESTSAVEGVPPLTQMFLANVAATVNLAIRPSSIK